MDKITGSPTRRTVVAGIGATLAAPFVISSARAEAGKPIRFAIIAAQSGPAGVADHTDYINGAKLAVEEINAAGGVNGREIKIELHDIDLLTPEGTQAAMRSVVDSKPHAIGCAFTLIRIPALEALGDYKAPYLSGDTNFDLDHLCQEEPRQVLELSSRSIRRRSTTADVPEIPRDGGGRRGVEADQREGPHHPRAEQLQHGHRATKW